MKRLVEPGVLIGVGVVLGVPLGMSIVPFLLRCISDAWVGFSGSIVGGIVGGVITVVAAAIAAAPVFRQLQLSERQTALSVRDALQRVVDALEEEIRWLYAQRSLNYAIGAACDKSVEDEEPGRPDARRAVAKVLIHLDEFRQRLRRYCNENPSEGRIAKQRRSVLAGAVQTKAELLDLFEALGAYGSVLSDAEQNRIVSGASNAANLNEKFRKDQRAFRVLLSAERRLIWKEIRNLELLAIGKTAGLRTYNDDEGQVPHHATASGSAEASTSSKSNRPGIAT
ncbi:hypothetical protein J2X65_001667 [Ancylobacter sp. 3268]|uniref:hypothetical protein n=1 Tax=Ancylobacter sp. 3268 TaxID=2817752 RepID=UPI0028644ED7|nr:hypothetical protein [Ancylobacter sp. 3268]MDR6952312.1 hypothetical protein [Ancylobacter sp. 3268]